MTSRRCSARAMAEQRVTNLVADLQPPLAQYRLLRAMLPRYRALAADPTLVAPQTVTRAIHAGDIYGDVDVLRHDLIALAICRQMRQHVKDPDGTMASLSTASSGSRSATASNPMASLARAR